MGEITRSIPMSTSLNSGEEEMGICYETAVRFLDLKDDDYEKIVKYIFKKQRDILRDMKRLTTDGISD